MLHKVYISTITDIFIWNTAHEHEHTTAINNKSQKSKIYLNQLITIKLLRTTNYKTIISKQKANYILILKTKTYRMYLQHSMNYKTHQRNQFNSFYHQNQQQY